MKIRILTQNPFSVGFGWVEQQASKYIENIKKINSTIDISFFSWTEKDFDILHIIWIHSWINPYWIEVLRQKWVKIVVSSVFYLKPNYFLDFRRPIVYKIFSFINDPSQKDNNCPIGRGKLSTIQYILDIV